MSANTGPARGMRDFLPEDVRRRQYVIGVIAEIYQRYGFEPLETPAVENIETLLGKYGEEGDRLIFKILKRGEGAETGQADLALRYDLTVPLARVVAEYRGKLPKFFKRYQVQPVWRADRPQKGRFREFYQCDVDAIGSTSMAVEVELLAAATDVLTTLGFTDFTIRLNHRQALSSLMNAGGVPPEQHNDALVALDKLDKIGPDGVALELTSRGVSPEGATRLLDFFSMIQASAADAAINPSRFNEDALAGLVHLSGGGNDGVTDLRKILAWAESTSASGRIRVDPSLVRGLSYYTGAIFEIAVPDLTGSLGGGGRYDNLIGMFLGDEVPACGISLGLERILVVMAERRMFPPTVTQAPAHVLVALWNAAYIGYSLRLAADLRAAGIPVELYPEPDKLGKQFKYADSRGIPFVAVIGEQEVANNTVNVKNMTTGDQTSEPRSSIGAQLTSLIRRTANTE